MQIGYARAVPSDPVRLGAQLGVPRAAGAEHVVHERTLRPRPVLRRCLAELHAGDVLLVASPDRLADTPAELLAIEADLTRRGTGLVVLSIGGARLDSRTSQGRLILAVLAGAAEIVRERRRETVSAGRKGRPVSIDAAQVRQLRATLGPAAIARRLGIARSLVYRVGGFGRGPA